MGNKETAEREFAQALVKELQELHTRNYLREIGIVPTQILFAAKHTIEELLRQVAVLETEAALREPAPQPQAGVVEALEELLDEAECWFDLHHKRGMTKTDYRLWLTMGRRPKAIRNARAALAAVKGVDRG